MPGLGAAARRQRARDGAPRSLRGGRAAIEVGLGVGLLLLSVLLTFRELGIWFSDAIVWPSVLIAAGGALIWRQSLGGGPSDRARRDRAPARRAAPGPRRAARGRRLPHRARRRPGHRRGLAFLQATGSLSAARDVLLAAIAVAVVLGVIFAPWVMRLVRSLTAERAERIRSRSAPRWPPTCTTPCCRRSRSCRSAPTTRARWPRSPAARSASCARGSTPRRPRGRRRAPAGGALELAAEEVEDAHGVPIEVVAVGDLPLDEAGEAIVAAAREAMQNAAKFGGGAPVDVYAEATGERIEVFVRDRGPASTAAIARDRRGVRESIVGRMQRHGGRAEIRSEPGAGTEVELTLERERRSR